MNRRTFIKLLGTGLIIPYVPKIFYSIPSVVEPKNLIKIQRYTFQTTLEFDGGERLLGFSKGQWVLI